MTPSERTLLILLTELVMDVLQVDRPDIRNAPIWAQLTDLLAEIKAKQDANP